MTDVVGKLWGFCHTLRHDGMDYGDYIEQLTYLLFLKMADERGIELPEDTDWPYLRKQSGTDLLDAYIEALRTLGKQHGILGDIFSGAQSRFTNPVNLQKLIGLIDETEWTALDVDVKAAAFEGLLEKAAAEGKKGAGQYFTPRLLIQTHGALHQARPARQQGLRHRRPRLRHRRLPRRRLRVAQGRDQAAPSTATPRKRIRKQHLLRPGTRRPAAPARAHEHVPAPGRAAHHASATRSTRCRAASASTSFSPTRRSAPRAPTRRPSARTSSVETSNKQLNFLQHVLTILKPGGRAAVVVPDNVLFANQAGEVFEVLMEDCDVHTVLRCPRGTFSPYTEGTKTNVIFFTKGRPDRADLDLRRPRQRPQDHQEEPAADRRSTSPSSRSATATTRTAAASASRATRPRAAGAASRIDEIKEHHYKLDAFKWIRDEELDDPDDLPEPEELITEAMEELQLALDGLADMQRLLEGWQRS